MSEPLRVALVGATGLVGRRVIEECIGRPDVRLVAIARREVKLPHGARMELFIAEPDKWGDVFEALRPTALICALGTTMKKVGGDEDAFRAIDQDLVIKTARAAKDAGVTRMVAVSSISANARAKNFYLRVKGETEAELSRIGFKRLDLLQPGLLRGPRENDQRTGEGIGQLIAPLIDPFLGGKYRDYRSIDARVVAQAALGFAGRKASGRFTHTHDQIVRCAREWVKSGESE